VDADLEALTASVELAREIGRQPALAEWTGEELYPGPSVQTRAELRDYVRRTVASYHHRVGSAPRARSSRPACPSRAPGNRCGG
jgi:choline dehydrogenase